MVRGRREGQSGVMKGTVAEGYPGSTAFSSKREAESQPRGTAGTGVALQRNSGGRGTSALGPWEDSLSLLSPSN